jgi:hypothetical protein
VDLAARRLLTAELRDAARVRDWARRTVQADGLAGAAVSGEHWHLRNWQRDTSRRAAAPPCSPPKAIEKSPKFWRPCSTLPNIPRPPVYIPVGADN